MFDESVFNNSPHLLTKEYVIDAISEIDTLTIENSDDDGLIVWDDEDAKIIPFHFIEGMSPERLSDLIYISPDIPPRFQIDKDIFAEYLWNSCDKNAFLTLEDLVVIWSEPDNPDKFGISEFVDSGTKYLLEKFGDEYAYEIGSDYLGQLWFERNVVVINMGEIVRTSLLISDENKDIFDPYFSLENQVSIGFLTTSIHELRHLQMDTNIILPEDDYPLFLGSEKEVENYCREAFENSDTSINIMPNLYMNEKKSLAEQIQSASIRAAESASDDKAPAKEATPER